MSNDKNIFDSIKRARAEYYKAHRDITNKSELFFTRTQYKLIKRFNTEVKNMSNDIERIFKKELT